MTYIMFVITRAVIGLALGVILLGYTTQAHAERVTPSPAPGEYVAFSLNVAQQRITGAEGGRDYRTVYPEVYTLGGINQLHGLVYDRKSQDLILVGTYQPTPQPLN